MNRFGRFIIFVVTCGINILFYMLCGYWMQMLTSPTPFIDLFYGLVGTVALGLIETRFGIQLVLRCRFAGFKKRVFDNRLWIQAGMLALYYILSVSFVRSVEFVHGIFYISVLAFLMTVAWFGWVKGGRVLWTGDTKSWFLDQDCKFYKVNAVSETDTQVFVVCALNELRNKTVIINKRTIDRVK